MHSAQSGPFAGDWPEQPSGGPSGLAPGLRRARQALHRLYGRSLAAFLRGLEPLPVFRGQRQRLFDALEYTRVDVPLAGVGEGLHELTVAWVSDVHAGFYCGTAELERLAGRLAELAPDVLCLGGDLVANEFGALEHFEALLALDPPLGTFAVPGNHEHFYFAGEGEGMSGYAAFLAERGVRLLVNEGVRLERDGASLWLGGLDDLCDGRPDLERTLHGRREGEPVVLLSHHPDTFHEAAAAGVGLQLSGHTHGGQVNFAGWSPVTHTRHGYRAGLFEREGASLYVGRGVGCSILPLRIGVRPEVPVLRIVSGREV